MYLALSALSVNLLIASVPLAAHHGNAEFDVGKQITMKGTVTEWFWANPHCFLKYDVKGDNGLVEHWVVETSNPPDMINSGWSKQSLKPGPLRSLWSRSRMAGQLATFYRSCSPMARP